MSTPGHHATVLAELATLKPIDATFGKAKDRLSASYGRAGVPFLQLIADPDGILVQTYRNDLRFLASGPAIVSEPIEQFRVPRILSGDHASLSVIAASDELAAAHTLMARFRNAVEAPERHLVRGDHELYLQFFKAMRLFRDGVKTAAFVNERDHDVAAFLASEDHSDLAVAIATCWFHPVEWTPSIVEGVLVQRPVHRLFVWDTKPHTDIGHEMLEEAAWIKAFIERACIDLGIGPDYAERAMDRLNRPREEPGQS